MISKPPFNPSPVGPCVCGSEKAFARCCGSVAKDRPPPAGIHIIERYVSGTDCKRWTDHLEQQPRQPLAVHNRASSSLVTSMSKGRVTDKVEPGELMQEIQAVIKDAFEQLIPRETGARIEWFENPQVLRYTQGGMYGRHADADHYVPEQGAWIRSIDRDYSLLLYLNEDFEGGELSFFRYNYTYLPRCGDLLFFPSDNRYVHQALPVRSGVRYAVVSWAASLGGPRTGKAPPENIIRLN